MRTFVAVELPSDVRTRIEPFIALVQAHLADSGLERAVRWTPLNNLHITLRFLGNTDDIQQHAINTALQHTVSGHQPFHLTVSELDCFPNRRSPRVFWLSIQGALDRLTALQAETERVAVQAAFEAERRAFSPHLTIGRTKRGFSKLEQHRLGAAVQELNSLSMEGSDVQQEALRFEVRELVLMQSMLEPGGARYSVLKRFKLQS